MDLANLKPAPGSRRRPKRVGRGPGSGSGKTSGRGQKGQKSRSGGSTPPGYEGGQMPLQRRLPKRGFRNPFRAETAIVSLASLRRFAPESVVDREALLAAGLVRRRAERVKLLAGGELDRKLTVRLSAASAAAIRAIEARGGSFEAAG